MLVHEREKVGKACHKKKKKGMKTDEKPQPEAPQVPTGFICLDPRIEGIMRWMDTRPGGYKDPWVEDSSLDDGNPLYDSD